MSTIPESVRVLHVDDEPDFTDVAAALIQREDKRFDISTATGADEGLDRLRDDEFDCIISDYDMPGMDGIEFLQTVRENHPDLPFILYTGKGSEEVAADAISAGVTDYLQKQSGTDQYKILANRIRNAVSARRSATEVKRSRYRLEQILKTVPSCVVQLNCEGQFIFANQRAVDVLGLEETEVTDRAYNDPEWEIRDLDGNPIPDEQLPFRQVRDSREPLYGFRHSIEWPDGTEKILEVNGAPLLDDTENVETVIFSITDVTEQWEYEERLQQTTARLQALFNNSPDMINVHDVDGNIIDPNPRLCEETGYDAAELQDMKVWELDKRIDPEKAGVLWEGMETGDQERLEGVFSRRDGSDFPVEVHIRRLSMDGEDRFIVISRDITERKQREQELTRQNDRLEEFASVVSHDLRNPLRAAEGHLELAREECESDRLDSVARAHERMDTLIEDLLTLARDGETVGDTDPIDLASLTERCWENVATADATLATENDRRIQADQSRLQQLLENLMRNAVEHGGRDVTITVGALADGFYVEDDGPGIPDEKQDDVFDAGYSTAKEGTGFGLSIVKQVAHAHGWDVRVTDGSDGGARFEITGVEFATA